MAYVEDGIEYCDECGEELEEGEEDFCAHCRGAVFGQDWEDWDDERPMIDGVGFADPGGHSSLRAATEDNPRDRPCPTCGAQNVLTRIDEQNSYQCDRCADAAERGW